MNFKFKAFLIGLVFGGVLSFSGSFFIWMMASSFVGRDYRALVWLFTVAVVPVSLGFACLGVYLFEKELSNKKRWILGFVLAFVIAAIAATAGTITVESMNHGIETVSVEGYLIWGPIYASLLLPLTGPLVAGSISLLSALINDKRP